MQCKKCPHLIHVSNGLFAVCRGPCSQAFHISYAGINKEQLASFSKNIVWICDFCLRGFHKWSKTSATADSVELKRDVTQLKKQVDGILNLLDQIQSQSSSAIALDRQSSSTPIVSSTKLYDGSGTSSSYVVLDTNISRPGCSEKQNRDDENFALFLTNIDHTVSETEVKVMVSQCLGMPPADYCVV